MWASHRRTHILRTLKHMRERERTRERERERGREREGEEGCKEMVHPANMSDISRSISPLSI